MGHKATERYKVEVEFPGEIRTAPSCFRVWHKAPEFMCLITEDNPDIIANIKVGDRVSLKYFGEDSSRPSERLVTVIRKISMGEQGTLRGRYLVDVDILPCRNPDALTNLSH
ncbi:MAG: hypothetical protein JXL84_16700 [Deltaproteobacteria bacterium]|nr:hypothetical protein [Deltaproteobacteria bacterium]